MDPADHHPEPFGEAFSYSSQRAAQMISLVAAAAEVAVHRMTAHRARQAERHEQVRRALQEQQRAEAAQARTLWAPAHDRQWLAQADLPQAARTWGAAAPYADTEPDAASAMRKTEEQLRSLHPYAMSHYDRLRSEGASPLDAMREAAPLFGREPYARPGPPGTRLHITARSSGLSMEQQTPANDERAGQPSPDLESHQDAEVRGQRIADRLRAVAQTESGLGLSTDELAIALEEKTNLPSEVIGRIARADSEERVATTAERARSDDLHNAAEMTVAHLPGPRMEDLRAADRDTATADTASAHASADRAAVRLASESFPCSAADGIRAAVTGSIRQAPRSQTRAPTAQNAQRSSLSS
jgi:hypothetical protein